MSSRLGIVVIGRNECHNLASCLGALPATASIVYVDSGSSDGSVALARALHVEVIELTEPPNFTAARARNAGLSRLLEKTSELEFVQMLDGDCEIQPGWLDSGIRALQDDPGLGAVFGRLRERHPKQRDPTHDGHIANRHVPVVVGHRVE